MWLFAFIFLIIICDNCSTCYSSLLHRQLSGYRFASDAIYPPGLQNQSTSEKNMLNFHKCRDGGEAYSAAYLMTRSHLIDHNTDYNLTWVNCEMASFIMMSNGKDMNKEKHGQVIQTLDVLDFSIIHLSAYERLLRKYGKVIRGKTNNIDVIKKTGITLKRLALENLNVNINITKNHSQSGFQSQSPSESMSDRTMKNRKRTIAIMPFLGTDMGSGHSDLNNRYHYLHTCFWSVYYYFPHIAIGVKSQTDVDYIRNTAKFPVHDVILLPNLPKSAGLPVGLVQAAKAKFVNKEWDFDYIYYTESDQVLIARSVDHLFNQVFAHHRRIILPHRLMPYPKEVLEVLKRTPLVSDNHSVTSTVHFTENPQWKNVKCCLQRQNCVDRKQWAHIGQTQIPIVRIHDLDVALGNANFHKEWYRGCRIMGLEEQHAMDTSGGGGGLTSVTTTTSISTTTSTSGAEVPYNSMHSTSDHMKHFCP